MPESEPSQGGETTTRCDWCNTPLWGHEEPFGMCMSCQSEKDEMRRQGVL